MKKVNCRGIKGIFSGAMVLVFFGIFMIHSYAGENKTSSLSDPNGYIISESNIRYLTDADVEGLSLQEINYAKNEIFARRGRRFSSSELQSYFDSKEWYQGVYEPEDFDANYSDLILNNFEKTNADFLAEKEFAIDPKGYQLDMTAQPVSGGDAEAMELYRSVLDKYAEGARLDFSAWDQVGEGLVQMDPNNPWNGSEICYAFVDLADDGIPELIIGRKPTETEEPLNTFGIVLYTKTPTNCIYSIYGYENGEVKLILGDGEYGWHTNCCITEDKKIWKKDYMGGGYYDFSLWSVQPNGVSLNYDVYMAYNLPEYPSQYCRLDDGEWVLSSEEEYREASAVVPMEIDWIPFV